MPSAPAKPCGHPGCGVLVRDGGTRCPRHQVKAWAKAPGSPKRVTGRKLQEMRSKLFAADPLCAECKRHGRVTLATERDHVVPLSEGGTDTPGNIQGLCHDCHVAKTQREALRGRNTVGGAVKSS